MNPYSIIPAIGLVLLALATITLLNRFFKMELSTHGRYTSIDGIRGYLAFFVFIHHAAVWYGMLARHKWGRPPSLLYSHFGPTSVYFFFMITAFLFFTKLLEAGDKGTDWRKLYISRLFRIMPLYGAAMLVMFLIVAILSQFTLRQPMGTVVLQSLSWLGFMSPTINLEYNAWMITAGVIWSLSYEWLFYFSLPFWSLLLPGKKSVPMLFLAVAGVTAFYLIIRSYYPSDITLTVTPFLAGIFTAVLVKIPRVQQMVQSIYGSFLLLILLTIVVCCYPSSADLVPNICNFVTFLIIAGGNTLFGLFSHKASLLLGNISYSIYLLHGMLLFSAFHFFPGIASFAQQSPVPFWLTIGVLAVILVVVCTFTYYYIERPGIQLAAPFTRKKNGYRVPAATPAP